MLTEITTSSEKLVYFTEESFLEKIRQGEVFVIDVRTNNEYEAAHFPFARSIPLDELKNCPLELPTDKEIVAYCKDPFCLLSDAAVALLASKGSRDKKTDSWS